MHQRKRVIGIPWFDADSYNLIMASVTHLPQLAAFGDEHYQVQKLIQGNRTLTTVERLDGEPRLIELSQMLGEVGEGTLRSAHELMQVARQMIKAK